MTENRVTIKFEDEDVRQLNRSGRKVCFTFGVTGSGQDFDVIAYSDHASSRLEISWTYDYALAATQDRLMQGARAMIATEPTNLRFKQRYTLPDNWTRGKVDDDNNAGEDSFAFVNSTDREVSAVVFQKIQGEMKPIHISGNAVRPNEIQRLTPKKEFAVWVENYADQGTMVSRDGRDMKMFNMEGRTSITVKFDGSRFRQA